MLSDWIKDRPKESNPLYQFSKKQYSAYIDYKYMTDMFSEQMHILEQGKHFKL